MFWASALSSPKSVELAAGALALFPCLCCALRPGHSSDENVQALRSELQAFSSYKSNSQIASAGDYHDWSRGVPDADQEKIGFGLSVSLIATILWDMFLLYMLMNPDPQVKSYSLKTVNTCMIIFIALSIESLLTAHPMFGVDLPSMAPVFFVTCWAIVCGLALYFRCFQGHHLNFEAGIALTSHILAFLGMTTFTRVIEHVRNSTSTMGIWRSQFVQVLLLIFMGSVFKAVIVLSVKIVEFLLPADDAEEATVPQEPMHDSTAGPKEVSRQALATESNGDSNAASSPAARTKSHNSALSTTEVVETLEENLTDALCLFLSYLLKNSILSSMFRSVDVPYQASPKEKVFQYADGYRSFMLLLVCILVSLYGLLSIVGRQLHRYRSGLLFLSFLTAWTSSAFVTWAVCAFVQQPSCLHIISAVVCSAFCCIGLVVADKLADWRIMREETAEELIVVFGFVVGCSWEKAFDRAAHDITGFMDFGHVFADDNEEALVFAVVLVAIMLPGWRFLVLPQALKPTPPRDFQESVSKEDSLSRRAG